ncbi:MAG: hypothetical protein ACKVI4_17340, partial [Actinomycetales bacterium]
ARAGVALPGLGAGVALPPGVAIGAGADGDGGADVVVARATTKRRRRGWMEGLLGAETGAHSHDPYPATREGLAGGAGTHGEEQHRVELQDTQDEVPPLASYANSLERVRNLVLYPLGGMMALSANISASPLWEQQMVRAARTAIVQAPLALGQPGNAGVGNSTVSLIRSSFNNRLQPTRMEIEGNWNDATGAVTYARASWFAVVNSLYDQNFGPSRETPGEVEEWIEENNANNGFDGAVLPRLLNNGSRLGAPAPRPGFVAIPDAAALRSNGLRGASAAEVMQPYAQFAGANRRFVTYAVQRGLVTDYGPHERPPDPVVNGATARLVYARGSAQESTRLAAVPAALPTALAARGGVPRVPTQMLNRWRERDATEGVGTLRSELISMIRLRGPVDRMGARPEGPSFQPVPVVGAPAPDREMEVSPWMTKAMRLRDSRSQALANTQRYVRWAPIMGGLKDGDPVMAYTSGSEAACAVATYEHLLENLREPDVAARPIDDVTQRPEGADVIRTPVATALRPALKACLSLRQLPHMIVFDGAYAEAARAGAARGRERIQRLMVGAAAANLTVPIYDAGVFTLRTLLPTERRFGNHVVELVPPAFSGVWYARAATAQWQQTIDLGMPPGGNSANVDLLSRMRYQPDDIDPLTAGVDLDILANTSLGLDADGGVADSLDQTRRSLRDLALESRAAPNRIPAPEWGLEVPHIPVGLPFNDRNENVYLLARKAGLDTAIMDEMRVGPDVSSQGADATSVDHAQRLIRTPALLNDVRFLRPRNPLRHENFPAAPNGVFPIGNRAGSRDAFEPHRNVPAWLDTSAAVDGLIDGCFQLTTRLHDLNRQVEAFEDDEEDEGAAASAGFVERERRGAIWE